jgi:hypothetical protein
MWGTLTRERSAVYNSCWSAQSFLGPSPAGLVTIFYSLRFKTPPTWRGRSPYLYSPGTGWPSYTPRHWVPFLSPSTTHRATWRYSNPPPRGVDWRLHLTVLLITFWHGRHSKQHSPVAVSNCCCANMLDCKAITR